MSTCINVLSPASCVLCNEDPRAQHRTQYETTETELSTEGPRDSVFWRQSPPSRLACVCWFAFCCGALAITCRHWEWVCECALLTDKEAQSVHQWSNICCYAPVRSVCATKPSISLKLLTYRETRCTHGRTAGLCITCAFTPASQHSTEAHKTIVYSHCL